MLVFLPVVILLAAATYASERKKLPVVLGAIVVGFIAHRLPIPAFHEGLGEDVHFLAELGILLLLFGAGVGIELKELGKSKKQVAILVGAQMFILAPLAIGVGYLVLPPELASPFIGLLFVMNSTAVVMAVLVSRGMIGSQSSNVLIGLMVAQDVLAAIFLAVFSTPGPAEPMGIAVLLGKGLAVTAIALMLGNILPGVLKNYRTASGVALGALGWVGAIALMTHAVGLSAEIGAFIAGVAISRTTFKHHVGSAVDFISTLGVLVFFFLAGYELQLDMQMLPGILLFLAIMLVVQPILLTLAVAFSGIKKSTASMIGGVPNQASEFLLVISLLAVQTGKINHGTQSLVAGTVVMGMVLSVVWSSFGLEWWRGAVSTSPLLQFMDRWAAGDHAIEIETYDRIVIGRDPELAESLASQGLHVLLVDSDPSWIMRHTSSSYRVQLVELANVQELQVIFGLLREGGEIFAREIGSELELRSLNEALLYLEPPKPRVTLFVPGPEEATKYRSTGLYTLVIDADEAFNRLLGLAPAVQS